MKLKKALSFVLTSIFFVCISTSCTIEPKPKPEEHICHHVCEVCGKCKDISCTNEVCKNKCECEEKIDVSGDYRLVSKTVKGHETANTYISSYIHLNSDLTYTWNSIDSYSNETITGTYSATKETITLLDGIKEYEFIREDNTITCTKSINLLRTVYKYTKVDNYQESVDYGTVDYDEELFGDDINQFFYNYCPTAIIEDNRTMHIWYCSNKTSGNVTDYVAYRKGTLHDDGKWTFSEKSLVLSPGSSGEWDMSHCCDPKVIKGSFKYNNTNYSYLMAYLGCISRDCTKNEVGIAVAQKPEGPWVKISELNPIGNYYRDYGLIRPTTPTEANAGHLNAGSQHDNQWGYGQPSLISVDKAGTILLFYTKGVYGATFTYCEKWDFSNLNNPVKLDSCDISNVGVVNASGSSDVINNADFVYDGFNNRIYVIKEDFPYTKDNETQITEANTILYYNLSSKDTYTCETLFNKTGYSWTLFNKVNRALTGYKRNHNCGFTTDEYGWLINPFKIPVLYTMSDLASEHPGEGSGQWPFLHTYRIHGLVFDI